MCYLSKLYFRHIETFAENPRNAGNSGSVKTYKTHFSTGEINFKPKKHLFSHVCHISIENNRLSFHLWVQ